MRTIKSFVRRNGRQTCAQQLAFKNYWPMYGIDIPDDTLVIARNPHPAIANVSTSVIANRTVPVIASEARNDGVPLSNGVPRSNDGALDFAAIFGRVAPTVLEIGFGNGEALVAMATQRPEVNFIGVDVYESGTGALFNILKEQNITNVRVCHKDVMILLSGMIPAHSLAHVYMYFPDPWPKKKHRKRRLLQTDFLDLIQQVLVPQGSFHFATDWQDYARHATIVLNNHPGFKPVDPSQLPYYCPRPSTKFYRRALELGHSISDLSFSVYN